MERFLLTTKYLILTTLIFLFPLFFLPITQEFFITNKLYLLSFGALLLFLVSTLQLLVSRKLIWQSRPFDKLIVLFLLTVGLSVVISSPNKIQALLNPNFGLVSLLSLTILYFYLSRSPHLPSLILNLSSLFLSLITIVFFQPFQIRQLADNLSGYLAFLKNPNFTPLGSQLDLAIFLGFFVVYQLSHVIARTRQPAQTKQSPKQSIFNFSLLTFNLLALALTIYSLLKPIPASSFQLPVSSLLPPFNLSWYAAVEILKNPLTALFGVGVDNFTAVFTRVKDLSYNQTPLWQISSFSVSRSALLHIFTETGIFGIGAFGLLLLTIFKQVIPNRLDNGRKKMVICLFVYLLICLVFFPPSFPVFFLFFITLAMTGGEEEAPINGVKRDLSDLIPIYLGAIIISLLLIAGTGYLLGRSYAAEYFFKKSIDGLVKNSAKEVYDNQRQAVIFNPYIERFRVNFSQTNLAIANNIASARRNPPAGGGGGPQPQLSEQDRQTIAQAIQAAIAEAKAAVALNPAKAGNWENLAIVYRNILGAAQGADSWTISSYQRAIIADPQNPAYRLNLGGVYYSLNNFDEAAKFFEQATSLKPDWPNAHYNLAWANFQKKDYQKAASEMQNALVLLDPKRDEVDYNKAQKDLEEFKKFLPAAEEKTTKAGETKPAQLNLPAPAPTIKPPIKLPKEASPEAK